MSKEPQTASEWTALLAAEADKEGVKIPGLNSPEEIIANQPRNDKGQFVSKEDELDEEIVYQRTLNIGGKQITLEDSTPEGLLNQVEAALAVTAPAPAKQETAEQKPGLSNDEMFDIGMKLQRGEVEAIDTYIEKSGVIDKYFEKKGVKLDELKAVTSERVSTKQETAWQRATEEFTSDPDNDYVINPQNGKLMGYKLAELGLANKPSVESLKKAYDALKEDGMVFPSNTATVPKKRQTGSSVFGSGGYTSKNRSTAKVSISQAQLDKMNPLQIAAFYNDAVAKGINPEAIIVTP